MSPIKIRHTLTRRISKPSRRDVAPKSRAVPPALRIRYLVSGGDEPNPPQHNEPIAGEPREERFVHRDVVERVRSPPTHDKARLGFHNKLSYETNLPPPPKQSGWHARVRIGSRKREPVDREVTNARKEEENVTTFGPSLRKEIEKSLSSASRRRRTAPAVRHSATQKLQTPRPLLRKIGISSSENPPFWKRRSEGVRIKYTSADRLLARAVDMRKTWREYLSEKTARKQGWLPESPFIRRFKGRRRPEKRRIRRYKSMGALAPPANMAAKEAQDEHLERRGGNTWLRGSRQSEPIHTVRNEHSELGETETGGATAPGIKIINYGSIRFRGVRTHFTSPSPAFEPLVKVTPPLVIQKFVSSAPYSLPLQYATKPLEEGMPPSMPPSTYELPEHTEEAKRARAKQMERESWLAREGKIKLAVSLVFSNRSRDSIQRLRNKCSKDEPGQAIRKQFKRFKILHWLDYSMHAQYQAMLTRMAENWEPFFIQTTMPGRVQRKMFEVGLKIESEKLQSLVKEFEENMLKMQVHTWGQVHRMLPTPQRLSLLPISPPITEFGEALSVMELLKEERETGLEKLRVEGLVLHGYQGETDTVFPPPKEFRFSRAEKDGDEYIPLAGEESVPNAHAGSGPAG